MRHEPPSIDKRNNSDIPPNPHRPLLFCTIILFFLLGFEIFARTQFPKQSAFWGQVDQASHSINVLFIGSSRVAAAIDVDAFKRALPGGIEIVNAAAGYSTPAEFYLALRNTFGGRSDRLRKAVIFVEAPGGMTDPARWADPWAHPAAPEMLTPQLRMEDLARYWPNAQGASVTARFENRLQFGFDYGFRFSTLITNHTPLGRRCLLALEKPIVRSFNRAQPADAPADLTAAGGIRTDREGIGAARKLAAEYAHDMMTDQRPTDWNATIAADTVALVKHASARLVFFEPPLHSLHRAIYETPVRMADRVAFQQIAASWQTPVLRPEFIADDNDFPDIWHLKQSRAADYTRALLTAWQNN